MLDKINGELPEENEAVAGQTEETAELTAEAAEETPEETPEETAEAPEEAAQEVPEETEEAAQEETAEEEKETAAEPAQEPEEQTANAPSFFDMVKEKAARFWKLVSPVKMEAEAETEAVEEEKTEEAPAEEAPAEVAEETPAEAVQAAPVRRKPADAFAIDFPVDQEPEQAQSEGEAAKEEQTQTEGEEAQPEETKAEPTLDELFADDQEPTQEKPAKKPLKPLYLSLIAAGCVVLLGVLAIFVLKGAGVDLKPRENDLLYKDSYTVSEDTLTKKADTVVATIGDRELTVGELQLYYMNGIYTFYSQNYYYMDYLGLDLTAPLDEQPYLGGENMTWEQYFLDAALKGWQSYVTMELLAEQDGFAVSDEVQAQIDSMHTQLDGIAAAYGYASAEEYLREEMAPGVSPETYVNFNRVYYVSNEYINNFYETQYPTRKEIVQYFKANEGVFVSNGITRDMGLLSDVRHILVQPQGGVTDESGNTTYSEDEWATALSEAERILDQWRTGEATEESFATLANTYSADGGSNTTGGLYEDIHIDSSYVPEFKNWAIDVSRRPGDVEIVKTTYGYHIMYFVEGENYFDYVVGEQLVVERLQNKLTAIQEAFPMEVNYKKIVLGESAFG